MLVPAHDHEDPDVDAWCARCNRGKYEDGDQCSNPVWHHPDKRRHDITLTRRLQRQRRL